MFRGLRTVIYHAPHLEKAKAWYSQVLLAEPYFDQPFYVGFEVHGFELALDPDGISSNHNVAYWSVSSAKEAYERLVELGSELRSPVQEVGEGIWVATVKDPFGNVIGIIQVGSE